MKVKHKAVQVWIKGLSWKIFIFTDEEYEQINSDYKNSEAICHKNTMEIHHRCSYLSIPTIAHELAHAYAASSFTHQTDMRSEDLEEIFAEIIAHHGSEICMYSKKIFKELKKIKKELR